MTKRICLVILPLLLLSACGNNTNQTSENQATYLTSWNDCNSLTALKDYVANVTNEKSQDFIPVKDRIATFDMDGTLYGELFPVYLEYLMLEYRALEDETYNAPQDVKEAALAIKAHVEEGEAYPDGFELIHANAAAKAYAGMSLKEFDEYCKSYLSKQAWGFENMTYGEAFYQPMVEVIDYLNDNNFTTYVVSGSDRFICRSLIVGALNVEPNHIIGMDVETKAANQGDTDALKYVYEPREDIIRTDHLLIKNLKMNKVKQIVQEIGKQPVLSFGNSSGDVSMHNFALGNPTYKSAAFMLIADDEVRDYGNTAKTTALGEQWKEKGYNVISMKDDFKTIYPEKAVCLKH